jgi:hypothetical protein
MQLDYVPQAHRCIPTPEKTKIRWCKWLGGFIDGDGCYLVSKKGYCSLENTVHTKDEPLLAQIKQRYGGSLT